MIDIEVLDKLYNMALKGYHSTCLIIEISNIYNEFSNEYFKKQSFYYTSFICAVDNVILSTEKIFNAKGASKHNNEKRITIFNLKTDRENPDIKVHINNLEN